MPPQHLPDFRPRAGRRAGGGRADWPRCALRAARPTPICERVIAILLEWIAADRKATPLKALQGMVWAQGYRAGQLKGHVYPDAVAALRAWHAAGLHPGRLLLRLDPGAEADLRLLRGGRPDGAVRRLLRHHQRRQARGGVLRPHRRRPGPPGRRDPVPLRRGRGAGRRPAPPAWLPAAWPARAASWPATAPWPASRLSIPARLLSVGPPGHTPPCNRAVMPRRPQTQVSGGSFRRASIPGIRDM